MTGTPTTETGATEIRSADGIERAIGRAIRAARKAAQLPMTELAARCGISQPYLSQLENGKASPSIHTLYRIANTLGLTPQDLLPGSTDDPVVSRRGAGPATPIEDRPDAAVARVLVGSPGRSLQVQEVTVQPNQDLGGWFEHTGEEFVFMLAGAIDVEFQNGRREHLDRGDTIWYLATQPHRWSLSGARPATILVASATNSAGKAH
jgi:transcriptional regulator with XRE-family HTH domain